MGEFADMEISNFMDDDYFWGEDTLEGYGYRTHGTRAPVQCKYCGSLEVGWHVDEVHGWRMINTTDHKPHRCKEYWQSRKCTHTIKRV